MSEFVGKSLSCTLRVKLTPKGEILSIEIARSSGDVRFDNAALMAWRKASPFPPPVNKEAESFEMIFDPKGLVE